MTRYQYAGYVTHYFNRIGVAVVEVEMELYPGDWILIEGPTTQVEQQVRSMQIEHEPVEKALPGQEIALKVDGRVREGDELFLIFDE